MDQNYRPLNGVTVVELATFVAAPYSARILADWGANVIKVEPPKGDPMRQMGGLLNMPTDEDENVAFDQQDANKHSIVLNLKDPDAMAAMHRLLEKADVFITNNREDALLRMELSYEQLKDKYPKLIYGHVSGFGEDGPHKNRPGYDFTSYYARGGISGTLYEKGTSPVMTVAAFGDEQVSMALASGICAALFNATRTGKGEKVSVNLFQTALSAMGHLIASSQYGKNPYPRSRLDTANPFQAAYPTKDGRWIQGGVNQYDKEYAHICRLVGREDLAVDERFNTFQKVKDNPRPFIMELDKAFRQKTADEWVAIFEEADLPFEKEALWEEILEDPQAWGDHDLERVDGYPEDEKLGTTRILVRTPVNFRNMGLPPYNKGPKLGEHTDEILASVGYTAEQIAQMREKGSVK